MRLPAAAVFVLLLVQVPMQVVFRSRVAVVRLALVAQLLLPLVRVLVLVVTFRCALAGTLALRLVRRAARTWAVLSKSPLVHRPLAWVVPCRSAVVLQPMLQVVRLPSIRQTVWQALAGLYR